AVSPLSLHDALPISQRPGFDQRAYALLEKEWIPRGAVDEQVFDRFQPVVLTQEGVEHFAGSGRREWVDADPCVICLAAPLVHVLDRKSTRLNSSHVA